MRFKLAQVQLEAALQKYAVESQLILGAYPATAVLPPEAVGRFIAVTRQFVEFSEATVVKETEIWITEFQSALLQVDSYID